MKLVSRSAWGARAYRHPNGAIQYSGSRRGVKFHYLGTPYADRAHSSCAAYIRSLQNSHMNGNGWSDIGYSFLVCTHGYVYEGRGLKRRNSANGNTTLNNQDYAICLLVGSSGVTQPTTDQLHGARDALEYVRKSGPCGTWVGGHRDGFATACPGGPVYAWVQKGCPRPGGSTTPPAKDLDMPIRTSLSKSTAQTIPWGDFVAVRWNVENADPRDQHGNGNYPGFIPALSTWCDYGAALRISGTQPGDYVQVRYESHKWANGKSAGIAWSELVLDQECTPGDDFVYAATSKKATKGQHVYVTVKLIPGPGREDAPAPQVVSGRWTIRQDS